MTERWNCWCQRLCFELYTSVPSKWKLHLVRGTPTTGVLLHWIIISRRWEQNQMRNREHSVNTDSPRTKKVLRFSGRIAKFQAPKTPRTDTILHEHLLAHTLIISVYSHYCIWSFCHHFPCKNVLITSARAYLDRFFRPRKHASCLHKLSLYC